MLCGLEDDVKHVTPPKATLPPTYRLEDYAFDLPQDRIAQEPTDRRDTSRLLVATSRGPVVHSRFDQLGPFLKAGDVLVLNQTRVINARCRAFNPQGTAIEVFFVDTHRPNFDRDTPLPVLFKPARRVRANAALHFRNADVQVCVARKADQGRGWVTGLDRDRLDRVMTLDGETPLPPYIKRPQGPTPEDLNRYQTVYAREPGAVAAPTAGLHFTTDLLQKLEQRGIELIKVTHHVGVGTFRPVLASDIRNHVMDAERYILTDETVDRLTRAKRENRRIIAVGTTSTRCLEANFDGTEFRAGTHETDLFIYPGYIFRVIDGLITNFHLPGSSLILLVSALMGRDRILQIYREAIDRDYRFYSYGDAMLLLPEDASTSGRP